MEILIYPKAIFVRSGLSQSHLWKQENPNRYDKTINQTHLSMILKTKLFDNQFFTPNWIVLFQTSLYKRLVFYTVQMQVLFRFACSTYEGFVASTVYTIGM